MKGFKLTKKGNDADYNEYAGEEEYGYGGYDDADLDGADDAEGFGMGSAHNQPVNPDPAPFGASNPVALKIINPKGYDKDSAAEIADFLLNGNTVLLNIENLTREHAIRLLDFLTGATHMVGGLMTKVGKTTIVVAPKNVDVSSIEAMVGSGN